jgi:hypothetical protein
LRYYQGMSSCEAIKIEEDQQYRARVSICESNFEQIPYRKNFEVESFDDYGIDDLGDAFDGFDLDYAF